MKKCALLLSCLLIALPASAEKICVLKKATIKSGKVNLKKALKISSSDCSSSQFELLDTATLTGPQGPEGEPGPFPDSLPSGKTITGVYSLGGQAAGANDNFFDSLTFSFPLATVPTVEIIEIDEVASANCPGSASEPAAAPGYLCVYEGNNGSSSFPFVIATNRKAGSLVVRNFNSLFLVGSGASLKGGASIRAGATASGFMVSSGGWAVTAP